MCLAFAEAANKAVDQPMMRNMEFQPEQHQYLRAKNPDGMNGISHQCPETLIPIWKKVNASQAEFDILVKNERRIETCFEGFCFLT